MAATKTNNDGQTAQMILISLRLLEQRGARLTTELGNRQKTFKDELTDVTKELNQTIDDQPPIEDKDCRERLTEIKDLLARRREIETRKAREIDEIKTMIQANSAAFAELLRAEPTAQQGLFQQDADSLGVSNDAVSTITDAVEESVQLGAEENEQLSALRERLASLGKKVVAAATMGAAAEMPVLE